ncbi:acetylornithine transaminase [Lactobacillus agilis]|nr:acetylornithine transaminase [Ligilactobacillus agilis]
MDYVFPTYKRFPFEIVAGSDWELTDDQGKQYLDLTSGIGVCNLGYNQPKLNQAVAEQLTKVWHTSNLYESSLQDQVAQGIVNGEDYLVSFCNSGTEANEAALKLARKATGREKILAFNHSFHGRTYGSLSVTGNDQIKVGFTPMLAGVSFAEYNDDQALEQVSSDLAAVIVEVVQGEGGVYAADASWLKTLAAKCQQVGALLIIDEVQTGMGRTGKLYAFENYGLKPDIFTLAKGLANGIPVGAMVGKKSLGKYFGPGSHGSTFAGNPLAMAAAKEVLATMDSEFLEAVVAKAEFAWHYLGDLTALECVTGVTGLGLMIGIHLSSEVKVAAVIEKLQAAGVLTLAARDNTLRLLPPLTMPASELLAGIEEIKAVLAEAILVGV